MHISLAAVEPDDLVSIQVSDDFSIEFRTPPTGDPSVVQNGRRFLRAWATVNSIAAVPSPDGFVELLQRRSADPGESEPVRHPHGWAITRPESADMHYFERTHSLCGAVVGYGGLCYPHFDQSYFPNPMMLCPACAAVLGGRAISE